MERLGPKRCAMCFFHGHVFDGPCEDDWETFHPGGQKVQTWQRERLGRIHEIRKYIIGLPRSQRRQSWLVKQMVMARFSLTASAAKYYMRTIRTMAGV